MYGEVRQQDLEALERLLGDGLPFLLAVGLGEVLPVVPEGEPHLPHDLGLVLEVPVLRDHATHPLHRRGRGRGLGPELRRQLLPACTQASTMRMCSSGALRCQQ